LVTQNTAVSCANETWLHKILLFPVPMKLGYTKYCCFLCQWNSGDKKNHYVNKLWPKQTLLMPEEKNVVNPPLVHPQKIYLPLCT
jgi:hypothetical protein